MLDMGPYYVTSLIHLLGPVVRVSAMASRLRDERTIGSGPHAGKTIPVEIDTHITGTLEHASGAISTVLLSFDAVATQSRPIEVFGETGTLSVPDPNVFDGTVLVCKIGSDEWREVAVDAGYERAARGVGLLDLVAGTNRASGALALHTLDVMTGLTAAASGRRTLELSTEIELPTLTPWTPLNRWMN